jgi:uncharacterized protein (TIGR02145 family)
VGGGDGDKGNNIGNYRTVVIGTQTWMAENLNHAVEGSKCYDDDPANCVKYGRLYDWSTAMGLPSSCNTSSCSSQIQPKHQGICPSGWHIPSEADWDILVDYVGGSLVAGSKLKATSGWNEWVGLFGSYDGNGTDEFGFSALPGGYGDSTGSFRHVGTHGNWWSATEYGAYNAHHRYMYYNYDVVDWLNNAKSHLLSVRCIKDEGSGSDPSSSSVGNDGGVSSSSGGGQSSVVNGTPVTYEGETYPTVVIGTQTWFAKNLNYVVEGSKCYGEGGEVYDYDEENDDMIEKTLSPAEVQANCVKYGRLYDWSTAMVLPSSCNESICSSQIQPKHQGICPSGWHIPSDDDWEKLFSFVDSDNDSEFDGTYESYTVGKHLKSRSGWEPYSGVENLDTYGFSALPGGLGISDGSFTYAGYYGTWWGATETKYEADRLAADRAMHFNSSNVGRGSEKSDLSSVRCLQD